MFYLYENSNHLTRPLKIKIFILNAKGRQHSIQAKQLLNFEPPRDFFVYQACQPYDFYKKAVKLIFVCFRVWWVKSRKSASAT